jgi:hypothetical protein
MRILDPICGSGTFLALALFLHFMEENLLGDDGRRWTLILNSDASLFDWVSVQGHDSRRFVFDQRGFRLHSRKFTLESKNTFECQGQGDDKLANDGIIHGPGTARPPTRLGQSSWCAGRGGHDGGGGGGGSHALRRKPFRAVRPWRTDTSSIICMTIRF